MRIHWFILTCVVVRAASVVHGANAGGRPNILFCIAYDWGSPHTAIYANDTVVQTPAFDQVANEGALFHNAYISSPSCTPSRVAMMAGVAPSFGGDYEKSIEILITP